MLNNIISSKVLLLFFLLSASVVTANTDNRRLELVTIPLATQGQWQLLQYSSIPANKVGFSAEGMLIQIDSSASPIIYPVPQGSYQSILLELSVTGDLNLLDQKQGDKGADDFLFRLGLVYEGDKRLNFWQRQFAANWVKTLYRLAPESTGVDAIHFYNLISDQQLQGLRRTHPNSELMIEHFSWQLDQNNNLSARLDIPSNKRLLALWLSSDGDDTQSEFEVLVKSLTLVRLNELH